MNRREERLERIRRVEREYQVAAVALGNVGRQLRADPSALAHDELRHRDFLACRDNLEATYLAYIVNAEIRIQPTATRTTRWVKSPRP